MSQTVWSSISRRLECDSCVQKMISCTLRGSGREEHEDDSRLSLHSAKMCRTCIKSEKLIDLLCKMFPESPEETKDKLEPINGNIYGICQ